jgi:hypothetical protein
MQKFWEWVVILSVVESRVRSLHPWRQGFDVDLIHVGVRFLECVLDRRDALVDLGGGEAVVENASAATRTFSGPK